MWGGKGHAWPPMYDLSLTKVDLVTIATESPMCQPRRSALSPTTEHDSLRRSISQLVVGWLRLNSFCCERDSYFFQMEMIHILRMDLLSLFAGLHCLKAFHQHGNPNHITSGTHLGRRWAMGSWPKDCIGHEDTAPFRISWHGGGEGVKLRRLNSGAYLQLKLRVRHCSPVCGMYSKSITNLRGRNDPDHYKTPLGNPCSFFL